MIEPLADYLLAKPEEAETRTNSGFYLPERAVEKPKIAEVLAVGPDVRNVETDKRILYKSYSATEVKVDGQDYLLVKEEDVIATMEADK